MRFFAYLLFIPLQIIWLPLSIIGVVLVAYRQLAVSSRLGVSQTAIEVINGRWAMDVFGLRRDDGARKLAQALPNNSVFGLWLTLLPVWVTSKLFGVPFLYPTLPAPDRAKLANLVPSRTAKFDMLIEKNLASSSQLVVVGAGLDTRAYGALKQSRLTFYELDESRNQAHKIHYLSVAGIDSSHVRFAQVNFRNPDWITALLEIGFDTEKKTIFLWEGVTLYLTEHAVANTLMSLKNVASAGSVVLTDLYSEHFVNLTQRKSVSWSLEMTDEEIQFGLDFSADPETSLRQFVERSPVSLGDYQFLGSASSRGPFAAVTELIL